uniref:Uncharacterized protein n=1 Tax=viral metagenome TaxID=1070528 RepID=A0A6C0CIT4_9ZZZZ
MDHQTDHVLRISTDIYSKKSEGLNKMDLALVLVVLIILIIIEVFWFFNHYPTKEERDEHQAKLIWAVVGAILRSQSDREYGVVGGTSVGHNHNRRDNDQFCYGRDPCATGQIHRPELNRILDGANNPAYMHPEFADTLGDASKVKHAQRRKWLPFANP